MLTQLAQLLDTVPTAWRLQATRLGPASRTRNNLRFVDLGNCVVRLRQAGMRGPSLVLATDPPVPLELYDDLINALSDRYRVTVFELPGFGCSLPRLGYRLSMPQAMASVTALLEQLSHGPHVLGLPCVTAYVAIALARSRPDLVDRLLLLQTPSWSDGQLWMAGRDPKRMLRRPLLGQLALAALRRRRIRSWYRTALADSAQLDRFVDATLQSFDHGACFCLASGFQDFLQNHHKLLGSAPQDTLIVWGMADPSHRQTDFAATAELAPNSRCVLLEGVGHFPELEATGRLVELLDSFLQPERTA